MSNEEIMEGNDLIAGFMGYYEGWEEGLPEQEGKAHQSFDLLMKVVGKIVEMGWGYSLFVKGESNIAVFIKERNAVRSADCPTPLLATYNAVVDLIKWYNKNKPTDNN